MVLRRHSKAGGPLSSGVGSGGGKKHSLLRLGGRPALFLLQYLPISSSASVILCVLKEVVMGCLQS